MGVWIGLAALALQIIFSPVFSSHALAMALDPLADVQICANGDNSHPLPTHQPGNCTDCCLIHCMDDAGFALAPATPDIAKPRLVPSRPAACARPLTRGPPSRAQPATGPPFSLD